jgi:hypothetical protein
MTASLTVTPAFPEHEHVHRMASGAMGRFRHDHPMPDEDPEQGNRAHNHPNGRHSHPHGHREYQEPSR